MRCFKAQTLDNDFLSLSSGMAFPFLLLCYFPKLLSKLPKPGAWMGILEVLSFSHVCFCCLVDLGSSKPRGRSISCRYITESSFRVWCFNKAQLAQLARSLCLLFLHLPSQFPLSNFFKKTHHSQTMNPKNKQTSMSLVSLDWRN